MTSKYSNFTGTLQIAFANEWFSVIGLFLTEHQIKLVCQYFGFNNGFVDENLSRNIHDYALLAINCSQSDISLIDCDIEFFKNFNLNRLELKSIQFTCYKEFHEGNQKKKHFHQKSHHLSTFIFNISKAVKQL